jgi:hypothetical protein
MSSFFHEIRQFHASVNTERSMIVASSAINTGTITAIKSECANLVINAAQIARFHYLIAGGYLRSIDDAFMALREFQLLALAEGMKLFEKPGHKDRFCHLVDLLTTNPTLLAEVVYFAVVSADSALGWVDNDRLRFVYVTIPSLNNFFLSQVDRTAGFSLIPRLIELHAYLHGYEFSDPHRFLRDLVFSFFLATNPVPFFDVALRPLLSELSPRALGTKDGRYSKVGTLLVRQQYFAVLVQFCERLLNRMSAQVQLLSPATLELIGVVGSVECGRFPGVCLFVFDWMFMRYIETYITFDRPQVLSDILRVLRCYFPQEQLPSRLYPVIEACLPKTKKSALGRFFDALIPKGPIPESSLSGPLRIAGRQTAFTGRDLTLLWQAVHYHSEYAGTTPLTSLLGTIAAPASSDEERYIMVNAWNGGGSKPKVDLEDTKRFEEIVDAFNLIDFSTVHFTTPGELVERILRFTSHFLEVNQRLRIEAQPDLLLQHAVAVDSVRHNRRAIQQFGYFLSSQLYHVRARAEADARELAHLQNLYIQRVIMPTLFELYPFDFAFRSDDFPLKGPVVTRVVSATTARLEALKFTPDAIQVVRLVYYAELLDHDAARFDDESLRLGGRLLAKFAGANSGFLARAGIEKTTRIGEWALKFQQVGGGMAIATSLSTIAALMRPLWRLEDLAVAMAIAMSGNAGLFEIERVLTKTLFVHSELKKQILSKDDLPLLTQFLSLFKMIREQAEQIMRAEQG